jgi:hypothetical protein
MRRHRDNRCADNDDKGFGRHGCVGEIIEDQNRCADGANQKRDRLAVKRLARARNAVTDKHGEQNGKDGRENHLHKRRCARALKPAQVREIASLQAQLTSSPLCRSLPP